MKRYHMKRKDREISDMSSVRQIITDGKYMTIALIHNHAPYIVTMNYGYDQKSNIFYFHCAKNGLKIMALQENHSVCATIINDLGYMQGECDHAFQSLVLWGDIFMVESAEEKRHALKVMINHLEREPRPVAERLIKENKEYRSLGILRFTPTYITGKSNIKAS